jgi:hypothetical protein
MAHVARGRRQVEEEEEEDLFSSSMLWPVIQSRVYSGLDSKHCTDQSPQRGDAHSSRFLPS